MPSSRYELLALVNVSHSKRVVCVPGCEAKFTAKSSLYVHVKKHKSPANKDTFVCPIENCNHKYLRKASLRHHMVKNHQTQTIDGMNMNLFFSLIMKLIVT